MKKIHLAINSISTVLLSGYRCFNAAILSCMAEWKRFNDWTSFCPGVCSFLSGMLSIFPDKTIHLYHYSVSTRLTTKFSFPNHSSPLPIYSSPFPCISTAPPRRLGAIDFHAMYWRKLVSEESVENVQQSENGKSPLCPFVEGRTGCFACDRW